MKRFLLALLAAATLGTMCACGSESGTGTSETTANGGAASDGKYKIGVCQLAQHPALDAATEGFIEAVEAGLGKDNVEIINQNASGESNNCTTIISGFVSDGVDLILANATAPLQAAASATKTIPVLGTSITDYASALQISNWNGTVGGNISGASDLAPLDQQAAMIKEWFPDAKNVGILYCSAEANSKYQVDTITPFLEQLGYTVKSYSFTDTNDVASVTKTACDESDVIYIPTDNTAASNGKAIANVTVPAKTPVVAGEQGICSNAVLLLSLSTISRSARPPVRWLLRSSKASLRYPRCLSSTATASLSITTPISASSSVSRFRPTITPHSAPRADKFGYRACAQRGNEMLR